jgi:non-specific serine/threonine protein kinase/serine/threonine-protein kinase
VNAEFWQQVKDVFAAALELGEGARANYLNQACAGKPELRAEVESLLESHEEAGTFIDTPVARATALLGEGSASDAPELEDRSGSLCGPWRLTELIGEGGMGAVYKAVRDDDAYRKVVAVKLLKHSANPSFIVSRFRTERQILASLDHPNIGRMIDGGTAADGMPFVVMEYIEGVPITDYCDDKKLDTSQRLQLFRQVCLAVHYAHQNLIVHRDLKPRNILVNEDGVPKLLDFGIAKILDPQNAPEETRTHMRLMTPEYASPEQIRGEPVNTTSDVYSLGVILYELLTGHRPYRLKAHTPLELERAVIEAEPDRPSTAVRRIEHITKTDGSVYTLTPELVSYPREGKPDRLVRRLSGDLDNIVLTAMRKDRSRRYSSAGQLAEDIRLHLEGQPVSARPDTLGYRISKFVGRNKLAVTAAGFAVLALVGALALTAWSLRVAQRERARAEQRFNDVRKLANSFLFEFHAAIERLPGSTEARALVVKKALEYLDSLAKESAGDLVLQGELADAYERVGIVQGESGQSNLGDIAGALSSYQKAVEIRERISEAAPQNLNNLRQLAVLYGSYGRLLRGTGRREESASLTEKALRIRESLVAAEPENAKYRSGLAISYWEVGGLYRDRGEFQLALEHHQKAIAITEKLMQEAPGEGVYRHNLALFLKTAAGNQAMLKDHSGALANLERARAIEEETVRNNPANADERMNLTFTYSDTGYNLWALGRKREAIEQYKKALAIRKALHEADPLDARAMSALGTTYHRLGRYQRDTGDWNEALANLSRSLALRKELSAKRPNPQDRRDLIATYLDLADLHLKQAAAPGVGRRAEHIRAAEHLRNADALAEQMEKGGDGFALDEGLRKQIETMTRELARRRASGG